jgi:integrase/recombinase XerD
MATPATPAGEVGEVSEVEILIQGYSSYLLSIGRAQRTATEYAENTRRFFKWFKRPPEYFREEEWDDYVGHLASSGCKASSIRMYCSSLRRFYKYLRRRKIVSHDPSHLAEAPKLPKRLPTWLLEGEIDQVITQARNTRERALIELLYACGLRNEECRSLELRHVLGDRLQIIGKGSKERIVPIPGRAKGCLEAWLKERPATTDYVFPSSHQQQMVPTTLRYFVAKLVRLAGIKKRVTPHTLRHSIATHLASRGVVVEKIQLFLGHESPETTMRYIHLANSLIQDAILKAHPRA